MQGGITEVAVSLTAFGVIPIAVVPGCDQALTVAIDKLV
jgi:hypothetical protein